MKKLFVACLVLLLTLLCVFSVSAKVYSGECGDNVNWKLDTDSGVLDITGYGDMDHYVIAGDQPWATQMSDVKKVVIGEGVTNIGIRSFAYCYFLTEVVIPNSVEAIGTCAFENCKVLKQVVLPANVSVIGDDAFGSCDSLEFIYVDEENASYSSDNFGVLYNKEKTELIQYPNGSALATFEIPDTVTSIKANAFLSNRALEFVKISDSVTKIGESAFKECEKLSSISIPDNVTKIYDKAFCNCFSLKEAYISGNIGKIPEQMFYNCESLVKVTISEGVTEIADFAFSGCEKLEEITLPQSVSEIGRKAFDDCSSLEKITVLNSDANIHHEAFYSCPEATFYGYAESSIIEYAKEDGKTFEVLQEQSFNDPVTTEVLSEVQTEESGIENTNTGETEKLSGSDGPVSNSDSMAPLLLAIIVVLVVGFGVVVFLLVKKK